MLVQALSKAVIGKREQVLPALREGSPIGQEVMGPPECFFFFVENEKDSHYQRGVPL